MFISTSLLPVFFRSLPMRATAFIVSVPAERNDVKSRMAVDPKSIEQLPLIQDVTVDACCRMLGIDEHRSSQGLSSTIFCIGMWLQHSFF